jgi:hypothetical protein
MRGYKDYNFREFYTAAALMEMRGHAVSNPASMDVIGGQAYDSPVDGGIVMAPNWTIQDALRRDFIEMAESCDSIVLLPGWEKSVGANKELEFARTIGLDVYEYVGDGLFLLPTVRPVQHEEVVSE